MDDAREQEFVEFVQRRHRDLVRAAFVLLGDVHQAEDLVQTALYRTFTAWSRLRSTDATESYVRTTMFRLAVRWRARRWSGEVASAEVPQTAQAAHDQNVVVGVDVWRALGALSLEQRAVLVLRFLEDLSEAEAAALVHCSVRTVKSRTSRALAALRSSGLVVDDEPGVTP